MSRRRIRRAVLALLALMTAAAVLVLPAPKRAFSGEASHLAKARLRLARDRSRIARGLSEVRDGDLVLRTGNDFISLTLRQFSTRNKTYSHCGIVRIEGGRVMVYHAIGGEDNPDARLRRDGFADFCDPEHNFGFGVFRYRLTQAERVRLDSVVDRDYRLKIPFDMKFDLGSDSSYYCAEFVYKALRTATGEPDFLPLSHIGQFTYVSIDDLFLNPHCRPVYQAVYR